MKLIDWQYYPKWHLSYAKTQNNVGDYAWYEYWITAGPIQTRWGGKSWCTYLRRSFQYTEQVKKILLEELRTVQYK